MDTLYFYNISSNQQNWELFYRVIFPIITLLIGAAITYGFSIISERRRIRLIRKYLSHSVNGLIKSIKLQQENFENTINDLSDRIDEIPLLMFESSFHTKNLEAISKHDVFKIIVMKRFISKDEKNKLFNLYNNTVEFIRFVEKDAKDEITNLHNTENKNKKIFNENFYKFQELINKKIKKYDEDKMKIKIVDNIKEIVVEGEIEMFKDIQLINRNFVNYGKEKKSIFDYEENLIIPIFNAARKYKELEIIQIALPIMSIINTIKNSRESISNRFLMFKNELNVSSKNLMQVYNLLNK